MLLRSTAGAAADYRRAFEQAGVPLFARQQQGYFDSYEVAVMLQFLRILDNPLQDIPMAAVLLSPMVGYTPAQLARRISSSFPCTGGCGCRRPCFRWTGFCG